MACGLCTVACGSGKSTIVYFSKLRIFLDTLVYSFRMILFNDKHYDSSSEIFFELFNDKLKLYIVWLLQNNSMRFKELSSALAPITNKTLTAKLKELEALHVISRKTFAEVPPRVEYSLNEQGKKLKPVLDAIQNWSYGYAKEFARFDKE